jgi:predicted PurR-regulated permease PerM
MPIDLELRKGAQEKILIRSEADPTSIIILQNLLSSASIDRRRVSTALVQIAGLPLLLLLLLLLLFLLLATLESIKQLLARPFSKRRKTVANRTGAHLKNNFLIQVKRITSRISRLRGNLKRIVIVLNEGIP